MNEMEKLIKTNVQNNPLNFTDPFGLKEKGVRASRFFAPHERKITKEECEAEGCTYENGKCFCQDENNNWVEVNTVEEARELKNRREKALKLEIMRAIVKFKEAGINVSFSDIKQLLNKLNYIDINFTISAVKAGIIGLVCDKNCYFYIGLGVAIPGATFSVMASPGKIIPGSGNIADQISVGIPNRLGIVYQFGYSTSPNAEGKINEAGLIWSTTAISAGWTVYYIFPIPIKMF